MKDYMIDITLPDEMNREFIALVPQQTVCVTRLMNSGIITNCILSSDRTKLWLIIKAESISKVKETLKSFPVRDYMSYEIFEADFNIQSIKNFQTISLN